MRLIDADELIEFLEKVTITEGITFETGFKQILTDIKNQPTAYDLEAVVQQLEELLEELSDCGDDWYASEKLNQAIEIVRNGGVK